VSDLFEPPTSDTVRVALPLPVDRLFDYSVPPELAGELEVGHRVRVSALGRHSTGIVVELASVPPEGTKLRPVEGLVDPEPVLTPALIDILREEAAAVLCPVGVALHAALPPGTAPSSAAGWALTARGREALRTGAARGRTAELLERLAGGTDSAARLARGGWAADELRALARDRLVTRARLERAPRARARLVRVARLAPGVDPDAEAETLRRAPRQAELLRAIAERGPSELSRLPVRGDALRRLAQRGLVVIQQEEAPRALADPLASSDRKIVPTPDQERACARIRLEIEARSAHSFLLHGVTGSGKTEVYLRSIAAALALGRQALIMVPEITLTHQIVARLRARFGDALAVLHSGLRPSERVEQWERLRRGQTPIAVGARSALFAPLVDPGVIVIDEEHDAAYKSDEGFRYHARSLAWRRARAAGCPLVLGSATPSLETRSAAEEGSVERLVLPHRIGGRPLPAVELVDLAKERALLPRGRKLVLTPSLRRALADVLAEGGQALLFLNRRGFSTQITCFSCGHVERCHQCDIALVYHTTEERLRCHYCDFAKLPREICEGCGSGENALLGIGTQRIEEEVRAEFPGARIARLDRDTAARRGATEETLRALRDGAVDVVVGTQMLAKGHDFPGVRLVGVVNADLGLHFPDFRAAERTFQLLTQVAGRAGRGGESGRVVVQTYQPEHYAIRPAATHDYERFQREELVHRRALGWPPAGALARIVVSAEDESAARAGAATLANAAREAGTGVQVLGPAPAPLSKLRGRHRFQTLLRMPRSEDQSAEAARSAVHRAAQAVLLEAASLPRALRTSVDIDPQSML
jgi:primosomal protein N' (replication factor Y)